MDTPAIVAFLARPESYSEPTSRVELIETHFAWVFLTDSHAWKLKKPMRTEWMDYRTSAARRRGCCEELILNRRLAQSVYSSVIPITRADDGTLALDGADTSRAVDWVVKMRRLPAARMLDRAIADGSVRRADLIRLATLLTRFFDGAVRQPLDPTRYVARLEERVRENRHDLSAADLGLDRARIRQVTESQLQFLARNGPLVGTRSACLIDGHGDLRPEHLYLGSAHDSPCVIDCLEFDARLRWLDPAEEMAFLALECRKLGAPAAARILLARYLAATLLPPARSLLAFYMSHSALTRAKLAAWHVRDPQFSPRAAAWRARALGYLADGARLIAEARKSSRGNATARSGDNVHPPQASDPAEVRELAPPASVVPHPQTAGQSKVS